MSNFNNNEYKALVKDLIEDIFYTDTSYRSKISIIRQYAEVIIRKLLDLEANKEMTLGAIEIQKKLNSLPNNKFIKSSLEIIRKEGNSSTHTQHLEEFTEKEFENIVDKLFDLLAVLLINYFEKYSFGKNNQVLRAFSLLPPIIRYKVLEFLYEKNPQNIVVIDKLVLATMKAFDADRAEEWIENKKDMLSKIPSISENVLKECGPELAKIIQQGAPSSMYEVCKKKISTNIKSVYLDFESAKPYYKANGVLVGETLEIVEFNNIMNFLYLGREGTLEELSSIENESFIIFKLNLENIT